MGNERSSGDYFGPMTGTLIRVFGIPEVIFGRGRLPIPILIPTVPSTPD
ncbi:MAG: hypothetical protein ACOY35_03045 [Bacillota bacterium]